jgi:hypothetical protein
VRDQAILEVFLACNAVNRFVLDTIEGGRLLTARVCGLLGECMHAEIMAKLYPFF